MHGLSEHNEACLSGSGVCASGSASAPGMELRGVTKHRGLVALQAVLLPLTRQELCGERFGALLPFFSSKCQWIFYFQATERRGSGWASSNAATQFRPRLSSHLTMVLVCLGTSIKKKGLPDGCMVGLICCVF